MADLAGRQGQPDTQIRLTQQEGEAVSWKLGRAFVPENNGSKVNRGSQTATKCRREGAMAPSGLPPCLPGRGWVISKFFPFPGQSKAAVRRLRKPRSRILHPNSCIRPALLSPGFTLGSSQPSAAKQPPDRGLHFGTNLVICWGALALPPRSRPCAQRSGDHWRGSSVLTSTSWDAKSNSGRQAHPQMPGNWGCSWVGA